MFLWTFYYLEYYKKKKLIKSANLTFILDLDGTLVHADIDPPEDFYENDNFSLIVFFA